MTPEEGRKKRILAACRMVLKFLMTRPEKDADLYALNLTKDLTEAERMGLLFLLLATFPADQAADLVTEYFDGAGIPTSLMDDPWGDAKFWAQNANAKELSAFSAACFDQMSKQKRVQFLEWANGRGS